MRSVNPISSWEGSLLGLSLELVEQQVLPCPVGRFDLPVDLIEEDALQC